LIRWNVRTGLIGSSACAALAMSLAACSSSSSAYSASSAGGTTTSGDTLTVGVVVTTTGSFAAIAGNSLTGSQVSATELNAGTHKFKINVIEIGTDGTPADTLQAVTKAVTTQHVSYVTGFLTSDVAAAVSAAAPRLGIDVLDTVAQDSILVGKECNPNYFKIAADEDQYAKAFSLFVQQQSLTSFDAIAPNYARGQDAISSLKTSLTQADGTLGTTVYPAEGATDFGSQIAQLSGAPAQALYVAEAGADAVAFAKQAGQFGLFKKYKAIIGQGFLIPPVVPAMGAAVDGVYDFVPWLPSSSEPGSQQFVKDYEAKSGGTAPWYGPAAENVALQLLDTAADKAGSTAPSKVGPALAGTSINSIQGQVQMRAQDHLLLQPLSTVQVQDAPNLVARDTWSTQQTTPAVSPDCHM
jgi:branched-chain amino acid transport system substrate-binding protein